MYPDYPSFDNYEALGVGDIDTTVDCGENKQVAILIAPKVHVDILGHATLPYFPYSLYLFYLFGIRGSYKWSGGEQSTDGIGFVVDAGPGDDGVEYTFIATMWPVTTNKILYSPDNGGAILCRSDGKPMAQYIV
jgi:hypothetical protein